MTRRASWLMVAKTFGFLSSLALPLLLVRRMDQEQYGLYKQAFLLVASAVSILPLGFHMSAFYFLPRYREWQRQVVLNIVLFHALAGAVAATALFLNPSILGLIFRSVALVPYARLISIVILLWIVACFLETAPIANEEIKLAARFIAVSQLTRAMILLAAAAAYGTIRALLYAAIVFGILQTVALLVYLESRFSGFWKSFDWTVSRKQLSYALPVGSSSLLLMLQTDLHNYFVSNRFGPAMFAVYSIGVMQLPFMLLVQEATNSVMITRIAKLQQQNLQREAIQAIAGAARKLAACFFPAYALLLVVGPEFIRFMFTARYADSWPVFAVNLTLLPLNIFLIDALLRAYASERYFVLRLRIAILAGLVLILALWTRQLGPVGVIAIVVSAGIVERIALSLRFGRLLGVTRQDFKLLKDVGKLAIASSLAGLSCAVLRTVIAGQPPFVVLAVCGTQFALVYLVCVHFLRVGSPVEYAALKTSATGLLRRLNAR
ncbi:MAG TPA: lipopolysaccharide biosynthesis protein [Bryobacteraceae bacterium]|nr:lipopolysaccharide biosynthesis protein [Bryobacteraceae bacterium]